MEFSPAYIPGRVSVIIISYNYGRFIGEAIDSALSQNVPDLEIIVVDDGSTDGTGKIITSYKDKVTYLYQENAGQSSARNYGLARCTGEFIQLLDSDDILGPGKISEQLNFFRTHPEANIAVCPTHRFSRISVSGNPKSKGSWHLFRDHLDLYLCYFNIAPPHAFLFRREVFNITGLMDSTVDNCEDYDLLLRAAVMGYIPQYTGSCAVYYRQHPESVTAQPVRQYLTDAKMHKKLAEHLNDNPAFPKGNRLEGLLAFSAGALETAARLYPEHQGVADELLDLALEQIKTAKDTAASSQNGNTFARQLFSLKMLCTLSIPPFRAHGAAKRIHENLKTILRSKHASTAVLSMAGVIMKTTFQDKQHSIMERLYLFKLLLQYGLNKYFHPYHCLKNLLKSSLKIRIA